MEYRPQYRDLVCGECGKLDELLALERGIDGRISFSINRDIFVSFENLYIVTDRVRSILSEIQGVDELFFSFPSVPGYYVFIPRCIVQPQPGESAYRLLRKCSRCGRYREIIWGTGVPVVPASASIGAIFLEGSLGVLPIVFATDQTVTMLSQVRPKLRKLVVLPLGRPPGFPEEPMPGST